VLLIALREMEVHPGDSIPLHVYSSSAPYDMEPIPDACPVRWSLSPSSQAATVDVRSGVLRVARGAADGTVLTATAMLPGDTLHARIRVVVPGANPLIGMWRQESEAACADGSAHPPAEPIQELEFRADGTFSVTWTPFESYRDYWGTYAFDASSGRLTLKIDAGNDVPGNVDPEGTASIAGTRLTLRQMYLGSRQSGTAACGATFIRTR
jgi:hypothetical protein